MFNIIGCLTTMLFKINAINVLFPIMKTCCESINKDEETTLVPMLSCCALCCECC